MPQQDADEEKRNQSWMRFLVVLPLDALLFFILLPIIVVQSCVSLVMSLAYLGVTRGRPEEKPTGQREVQTAQPSSLKRNVDALLQCCGQLDSVRRSLGVFPRYGS